MMSDAEGNRGPADRSRINVNEDYELEYWTKELGVSKETLRATVASVGVSADAVADIPWLREVGGRNG